MFWLSPHSLLHSVYIPKRNAAAQRRGPDQANYVLDWQHWVGGEERMMDVYQQTTLRSVASRPHAWEGSTDQRMAGDSSAGLT
jgi:hypothetical protein